jgi:hypothetical protein
MSSFKSTVRPAFPRAIGPFDKWLSDPVTGAIVGVMNPNSGGKDIYFSPIPVTASQIQNPTAEMLAMVDATFALDVAPYTRYYSTGDLLIGLGLSGDVDFGGGAMTIGGATLMVVPVGSSQFVQTTLKVQESAELIVQGQILVAATAPF